MKKSQQTSKLHVWLLVSLLCLTTKDMTNIQQEIWKDIVGFEGLYQASTQGQIRSLKYSKIRTLKPGKDRSGYLFVILYNSEKKKFHKNIHRIIMMTFEGKSDLIVDHINGDKKDNRLTNLRYCSFRDNLTFSNVKRKRYSSYAGVSRNKNDRKKAWYAQIVINGKNKYLGAFHTELEAHNRYKEEADNIL